MANELTTHNQTTALAAQQEQRSQSLAAMERMTNITPASKIEFRNQLTACLVLTAPSGMTEEARSDWLRVAWMTLSHLPSDLLERGCKRAREKADHPSKIVPYILKEVEDDLAWRKRMAPPKEASVPKLTHKPEKPNYCTPEQAKAILDEVGFKMWGGSDEL